MLEKAEIDRQISQRLIRVLWIVFFITNFLSLGVSFTTYSVTSLKQILGVFFIQLTSYGLITLLFRFNKRDKKLKYYANIILISMVVLLGIVMRNPEVFSAFYFIMIINITYGDRKLHYLSSILQLSLYLLSAYFLPILFPVATPEDTVVSLMITKIGLFLSIVLLADILHSYMIKLNNQIHRKDKEMFTDTVGILIRALEEKDIYTNGHSQRVSRYAYEIAKHLNLSEDVKDMFLIGGLLHDVGKIGIPDSILNKQGSLTAEEFIQVKNHSLSGTKILQEANSMKDFIPMVLYHHERYDGKGYPHGLKGGDIPLEARILSVADAFDAMTSRRSYRNPQSEEFAFNEIIKMKGTQFCPTVVEVFQKNYAEIKRIYIEFKNMEQAEKNPEAVANC